MKKVFYLSLLAAFALAAIGCGSGSETLTPKGDDKPTVGTKGKKSGAMESDKGLYPDK